MNIEILIGRGVLGAVLCLTACAAPAAKPAPTAHDISAPEPTPGAKALRAELTAVVRAASFVDTLPAAQRAKLISEPLEPGMVIVYMVDLHGAARLAEEGDLTASAVNREALRAVVEWNLSTALPLPPSLTCEPGTITELSHGNYFESSRLLVTKQWTDLAAAKGHVVVAAPRNDMLFVSCNPTPANIAQLSTSIRNLWPRADHPVSPALLSWAGSGWEELKPPR
jgi:hypothetical protein